jgi:hypothetical protein
MTDVKVARAEWDDARKRFVDAEFKLPINPYNEAGVLLVPKRFVREIPVLTADDWFEYLDNEIRDDLNLNINESLNRERIIEIARSRPELVREWTEQREGRKQGAYNVDRDPHGLLNWLALGRDVARQAPISVTGNTSGDLSTFIEKVNTEFAKFVELQGGWRLLWNDDSGRPKREESIQLLYKGVVQAYCAAEGIVLDREVELGRGPVDFAFSKGAQARVLMEVKKLNSDMIWHGLEEQLTSYMASDGCTWGWYLVVRFYDSTTENKRAAALATRTADAAAASGFDLRSRLVDARRPKSASKAKKGKGA